MLGSMLWIPILVGGAVWAAGMWWIRSMIEGEGRDRVFFVGLAGYIAFVAIVILRVRF
jgi:hypothetical protein